MPPPAVPLPGSRSPFDVLKRACDKLARARGQPVAFLRETFRNYVKQG
jgi:hypothetical protein